MENITTSDELKNAIQILEFEKSMKKELLIEQFIVVQEGLRPANLLKGAINNISSSPFLLDNILGVAMGLVSGYVSKRIAIGASGNIIRKLFGSLVQFGVTNGVIQKMFSKIRR